MGGAVRNLWNGKENEHDVSKWKGVQVGETFEGHKRVVSVVWKRQKLSSRALPVEICALSALIFLDLADNDLQGQIPCEIGR